MLVGPARPTAEADRSPISPSLIFLTASLMAGQVGLTSDKATTADRAEVRHALIIKARATRGRRRRLRRRISQGGCMAQALSSLSTTAAAPTGRVGSLGRPVRTASSPTIVMVSGPAPRAQHFALVRALIT